MNPRHALRVFCLVGLCCASSMHAEDRLGADFRNEGDHLKSCTSFAFGSLASCAETLFTDFPIHIAAGSLAPQNGIGVGLAMVEHWTTANWRNSWDIDAVATPSGAWRAGGYLTLVWSKLPGVVVTHGPPKPKPSGSAPNAEQEQPVLHFYGESTSLNKLAYFGLGPQTLEASRAYFGMTETVAGGNVVWPIPRSVLNTLHVSLLGEANGRFVNLRSSLGQGSPSLDQIYTSDTAPGSANQPAYAQFGQAIRVRPEFANGHVRLNYLMNFQEYVAPGNSKFSFQRLTLDFSHEFPLYSSTRSLLPKDSNGPDECTESSTGTDYKCPPLMPAAPGGRSHNLEGSFGIRFVMNETYMSSGNVVPFYFQPTLGGSDVNGTPALTSYQDYRFRAPNFLLARASFEHSIWGPLGVSLMVDEGKVALTRGDLDFHHLLHSYAAGLTLRAGGLPMVYLLFAWGGHEGTHTIGSIDTSLLGGSSRPSLY